MTKLACLVLICLSLRCVWSYYQSSPPPYQPRIIYRHHIAPYQTRASYMQPVVLRPPVAPYGRIPVSYGPPEMPFHRGAATPVSIYLPPRPQSLYAPVPYAPVASHQQSYFSHTYAAPPPPPPKVPRFPIKQMMRNPFHSAIQQYPAMPDVFGKIKPYLFGGSTVPRSLPHHPYYPNFFPPHHFTPNRPLHNRPSAHHAYPTIHEAPPP